MSKNGKNPDRKYCAQMTMLSINHFLCWQLESYKWNVTFTYKIYEWCDKPFKSILLHCDNHLQACGRLDVHASFYLYVKSHAQFIKAGDFQYHDTLTTFATLLQIAHFEWIVWNICVAHNLFNKYSTCYVVQIPLFCIRDESCNLMSWDGKNEITKCRNPQVKKSSPFW